MLYRKQYSFHHKNLNAGIGMKKVNKKAVGSLVQLSAAGVHRPAMICYLLQVGLAQWYHARLRGERSRFGARSWQPEMTLGIIACK